MQVRSILAATCALLAAPSSHAAGTLMPAGSPGAPIQVRDHRVSVVIDNGFARTEVSQTFYNPNEADLEAVYTMPLPKSASLSEVTVWAGQDEIHGEVVEAARAQRIYEEERDAGHDAGLATKESFESFDFKVSPVRAKSETRIRFVYYQPLAIDTGVGRYVYPLERGGNGEEKISFWEPENAAVEGTLEVEVELRSAWPVTDVRVPGFEDDSVTKKMAEGHFVTTLSRQGASLDRDFVFYYKLEDDLPGRVEVVAYKPDETKAGTYMVVVTPGLDLGPLAHGADYCFVLDVSGSMASSIQSMGAGVSRVLGRMGPEDRFRIVTFAGTARDLTHGFVAATRANVEEALRLVAGLHTEDSTNLYAGLELALEGLDDDRATSIVLVTDAVANAGEVRPQAFHKLAQSHDVRVFGFLMGNSANWPLLRVICDASGGFYAPVSNQDDIVGQILLAKSKITSECLHEARLGISMQRGSILSQGVKTLGSDRSHLSLGVQVTDRPDEYLGKVYRGQQLVLFGRYEGGGPATLTLSARLTGQDRAYTTTFDFPEKDTANPEIERLWALDRIETIERQRDIGLLPEDDARTRIRDLGIAYQIVTDETSMLVLADRSFAARGIDRKNQARLELERIAQGSRAAAPIASTRVDAASPMFPQNAPSLGGGGGAIDPLTGILALGLAALGFRVRSRAARP